MTEEIIHDYIMQDIVQQHNLVDYQITTLVELFTDISYYTSIMYSIDLNKGDDNIHMVAKIFVADEQVRPQAREYYKTEEFGYTKLAKVYEKLQEEHDVPQEHRLSFAKCYGCKPDICHEIIVLEDFRVKGYKCLDSPTYDWDYAKSAISELAKMHGLSFAYGEYHPEEFNVIANKFNYKKETTNDYKLAIMNTVLNETLAITKEEHKEKLRRFFESFTLDRVGEFYKWSKKPVLIHGYFGATNLMHRIREDGTVDIKIIDLQYLKVSSPIIDLLMFFYNGNSDEEFRAKYYHNLLDHYYAELEAAMKRFHLDPDEMYSRSDFYKELEEKLAYGLTTAVVFVHQNLGEIPEVIEEPDLSIYIHTRDLAIEIFNGIINDYVKFGVLK